MPQPTMIVVPMRDEAGKMLDMTLSLDETNASGTLKLADFDETFTQATKLVSAEHQAADLRGRLSSGPLPGNLQILVFCSGAAVTITKEMKAPLSLTIQVRREFRLHESECERLLEWLQSRQVPTQAEPL